MDKKIEKEVEKDFEYVGYGKFAELNLKLFKLINKPALSFKRRADRLRFEQFKMKFGERDDDIHIVTFPKSGTTLMQVILHQLTTKGNMNFNHIYEVSPWIRNASLKGEEVPNLPSPRIIKSHDYYRYFTKETKGRFIFVLRNGMDVAVSLYNQNKSYNNKNLKFDNYIKGFLKSHKDNWFNYVKSWFKNKYKFPILYLKYEDLLENKETEIRKIIEFCKLDVDEEAINRAIKYSSFEFMKAHETKFGEQAKKTKVYDQFIRKGKKGEGKKQFSKEQEDLFTLNYNKNVKKEESQAFG